MTVGQLDLGSALGTQKVSDGRYPSRERLLCELAAENAEREKAKTWSSSGCRIAVNSCCINVDVDRYLCVYTFPPSTPHWCHEW